MKKIFTICALTLVVAAVFIWRTTAKPSRFGTFTGAPRAEVATLIAEPKAFLGKTVEIEGTITEQCKAMGCFFTFRSGKEGLRVDLQEVAMHAPMREGRPARVEGQMVPFNDGYQFYASAVEFQ
ncbi:MAG TPA: hypothetical protein VN442_15490 [Bryobacteraceae bacterium]|nr:hypothetical protein [Bryobacteraceae bacterium]